MPFDVAKLTVTVNAEAVERVTVILVEVLLSSDVETSLIDKDGVSSSVIVNVPVASLIVAFDAFDRVMVTVSFPSGDVSVRTVTGIVPVVAPALIVRVLLVAV